MPNPGEQKPIVPESLAEPQGGLCAFSIFRKRSSCVNQRGLAEPGKKLCYQGITNTTTLYKE